MKIRSIFIFSVLATAITVFSQTPPGKSMPGKMPMGAPWGSLGGMHGSMDNMQPMMMDIAELKNLLADINIDKAISVKIIAIARSFLSSLDERIIRIQKEELKIKEEVLKEKPDLQAIQNAISRKTQIFGEIEFNQIKRDLEIKVLLTEDEYDRWKSVIMQKMRQMMPNGQVPPPEGDKKPFSQK
jgi:hypothetical protein